MSSASREARRAWFVGTNGIGIGQSDPVSQPIRVTGSTNLPADTVMRRNSGQLQGSDIPHLRAAGLEYEAQQLEQQVQRQMDQRMADQALSSRENYQKARSKAWSDSGILARMGHTPIDPAVAARNRRMWGISEP